MTIQKEITLPPFRKGFHLITNEIIKQLPELPEFGLVHIFIKHTSAGLTINENADSSVRKDMEYIFNKLIPENDPEYTHIFEGSDDMPAHVKAAVSGQSISIPIRNYKLNLGIWQGIYLCEFRNNAGNRKLCITIIH
jgi:secondary thiamine-phosphate synthase enzyme